MLTQVLIGAGFDPSAVIGGKLPFIGGNSYVGESDIIVCEACEYVDSFLEMTPFISVILNVDADHLDYFKNLDNIKKSFNRFAHQTTNAIILNGDDKNTVESVEDVSIKKITFGLNDTNDYYAANVSESKGAHESFDLMHKGEKLCAINLMVPGKHNIYNALAAAATAHYLGASPESIAENLGKFGGVHRRFEILGTPKGITVADDFAHHPTELRATLNAAVNMGFNKVWAVFQPHTFSRTAMLLDDFAEALRIPDEAIISEILPVRETNTYNIYNTDLGAKVPGSKCIDTFEDITEYVTTHAKAGDLILTMGGGPVYMCAKCSHVHFALILFFIFVFNLFKRNHCSVGILHVSVIELLFKIPAEICQIFFIELLLFSLFVSRKRPLFFYFGKLVDSLYHIIHIFHLVIYLTYKHKIIYL